MKKIAAIRQIALGLMLAAASLAPSAVFAQQGSQASSELTATEAFASMSAADQARDMGDWAAAVAGYRGALDSYRRLAAGFPDWEPETVRFRISYCSGQIDAITRATGKSEQEMVTHSTPAPGFDSEAISEPASGDDGELQERPEASTADEGGAEIRELSARVTRLEKERAELAQENETLKESLEQAIMEGPGAAAEPVQPDETPEVLRKMREALAQERSGNFVVALEAYGQLLSVRPAYAAALKGKGRCLLQMGKFDESAAVFRGVASANRDDVEARVLLGIAYCMAEKYNAAVEALTPLVVDDPSNARARCAIGAAWMGLGDTRAARAALEKAVALAPGLADAHFNLAKVLHAGGPADAEKAREHYRKAITLGAAPDPELQKRLGEP